MARTPLAGALLVLVLVATSGCIGFLLGDTLAFSATKATVGDDALSEAGYEESNVSTVERERTFEAGGQSRDVKVTNWVAEYEKSVGIDGITEGTVSTFTVLSSPKVEVAGESFNPLADYSNRKLVDTFVSKYGNVNDVRETGSDRVTMLGSETKLSHFTATARTNGVSIDVNIHVASVEHGDDVVVVVAVSPELVDERGNVERLVSGIEHDE